jgi:hypothetical protein
MVENLFAMLRRCLSIIYNGYNYVILDNRKEYIQISKVISYNYTRRYCGNRKGKQHILGISLMNNDKN